MTDPHLSRSSTRRRAMSAAGVLAATLLTGCGLLEFDVSVDAETEIEGNDSVLNGLLEPVFDGFMSIDITESQEFRNEDIDPEHVESVRLTSLVLELTDPDGVDFSFLESLEFYVETDGEPRQRIARAPADAFDEGSREIHMVIDDLELKPYATAESFHLDTEASVRRAPSEDKTVEAEAIFRVRANPPTF